jgi:aminoacyl-tRNA hydrolase
MLTLILGLGNIGKKYDKTRHNLGFEVVDRVVEKLGAVRQDDAELYQWWRGEVEGTQDGQTGSLPRRGIEESTINGGPPRQREERLLRSGDAPETCNDDVSRAIQDGQTGASAAHERRVSDQGSHSKLWGTEAQDAAHKNVRRARTVYLAKPTTYMNGSGEAAKDLIERLGITPAEILVIVDDFQIPLGAIRFRPSGSDGGHNGLVSVVEELGTHEFPRLRLGIGLPQDKAEVIDYVLTKFTSEEKLAVEKMLANAAEGVIFALQHRLEKVMSKHNFNPAPENLA